MIAVEELAIEDEDERDIDRWQRLGAKMIELDYKRFQRLLAIAATFVSVYENPEESEDAFQARLRRADPRGAS